VSTVVGVPTLPAGVDSGSGSFRLLHPLLDPPGLGFRNQGPDVGVPVKLRSGPQCQGPGGDLLQDRFEQRSMDIYTLH
jgi:hypothetical protein